MNKKFLVFGLMGLFVMAFAAAGLVSYLSNTTEVDMNVKMPISISFNGADNLDLDLFAGQSVSVETLTKIHIDGVTGHIAEIKIPNFDGIGINVSYQVDAYLGVFKLIGCQNGSNTYYYIGDPTETLNKSEFNSTTTFKTALNLDTNRNYKVKTKVIMANTAVCDLANTYEYVANA